LEKRDRGVTIHRLGRGRRRKKKDKEKERYGISPTEYRGTTEAWGRERISRRYERATRPYRTAMGTTVGRGDVNFINIAALEEGKKEAFARRGRFTE